MGDDQLRPIGAIERFNLVRNELKLYHSVQLSVSYAVPRSLVRNFGGIKQLVYTVLNELLSLHPILGVTATSPLVTEPKWVRLEKIDLQDVVKEIDSNPQGSLDSWVGEAHQEFIFELGGKLPLWRVALAASQSSEEAAEKSDESARFAVGIFCHHSIGDGLSTRAFQLTFLDVLNKFISDPPSDKLTQTVVTVPKLALLPNLELETKQPISALFALKELFEEFVYAPKDTQLWTGPPVSKDPKLPPLGSIRSFLLPAADVERLLARCRKEKTTATAVISVLVAQKIAELNPKHQHFIGAIPFSMRKFSKRSPLDMCCHVSSVTPTFSSAPSPRSKHIPCSSTSDIWSSARAVKKTIIQKTATPTDQPSGLLKFISTAEKMKSYFLGMFGEDRKNSFEVSNIGVLDDKVDGEKQDKARFENLLYSQGMWTYGPPYSLCLATVKSVGMSVAMSWEEGIVKQDDAVSMLEWLEAELKTLGST